MAGNIVDWYSVDIDQLIGAYEFGAGVINEQIQKGKEVSPDVLERFLNVTDAIEKQLQLLDKYLDEERR